MDARKAKRERCVEQLFPETPPRLKRDEDLEIQAMETLFTSFPPDKQRTLAYKFLKLSQPPVSDKFKRFLFRGTKKVFTETEIEHAWEIWSFIRTNTWMGYYSADDEGLDQDEWMVVPYSASDPIAGSFVFDVRGTKTTRDEFFEWVLTDITPDILIIHRAVERAAGLRFSEVHTLTINVLRLWGWTDLIEAEDEVKKKILEGSL